MAHQQAPMPIAVVGISCRLPGGVSTPGDFYRMLCRKRAGWSPVPVDRFNAEAYQHPNPDKKGCFNSRGGYFIKDDISEFDAAFFDMTKKEAESMDPAQRLLLECAYEALENAGIPKEAVSGKKVGVFVGGNYTEHRVGNLRDLDHVPSFDATGNQAAFLAGRVAYYFNLRGPTFTIDTACSSSMHAIHLAVQSIRMGESEQAIVGASHLITHPDIWVSMGKLRLFSDDGKTYAFDERAKSGYARGEGAGCLVLKPLAQAQQDNDHVFSVITHTGINHNGRTVGIVAPSQEEQANLLKKVFAEANIDPRDVGFFEAHGTGTKKGDPIEAGAIHEAVGKHFTPQDPLYLGSAKSNVGHLECVSGVVSTIKAVLMLYYGFILPQADFKRANEAIPLEKWNMRVATRQKPWPAKRKYVCVNNFGFSGSNSTCILSAAPQIRGLEVSDNGCYSPLRLFVVSANDESALRKSVNRLGIWIEQHAELYQTTMPRNLSYTLCQRRSHLPWRVAVVAGMCSDVATALNRHDAAFGRASTEPPRVAFVYTGQGAQWHAMGRELLRTHPVYFNAILRADYALRAIGADFSVLEELQRDKPSSRVGLAHISQPLCSAIQLALTDLFASFGVRPTAVTGHSSGEIAAAYVAGALTFESAMAAAYYRGHVITELKKTQPQLRGTMMAVGAGAEALEPVLSSVNRKGRTQVVAACENSPSSSTLSGDEAAIDMVGKVFEESGIFNRKLFVDVAYHSPHMEFIAESYLARVRHIQPQANITSEVEFFSSLRAQKTSLEALGPQYWVDNLTQPVRFCTALRQLLVEHRPDVLVEIGPHAALKGPIMQTLKTLSRQVTKVSYIPSLVRNQDATRTCLEAAGELFVRGYPLNFFEVNHNREEYEKPELVPSLYTYPWSRQKYWYESRLTRMHRLKPFARNDLLGTVADWSNDLEPTWRNVIRTEDLPWLRDYRVQSDMVFPTACYISMVIEAATQSASTNGVPAERFELKNVKVPRHLFLQDGQEVEVLLNFRPLIPDQMTGHAFTIFSHEASRGWLEHCTGTVIVTPRPTPMSRTSSCAALGRRPQATANHKAGSDSESEESTATSLNASPVLADSPVKFRETTGKRWFHTPREALYRYLEAHGASFPASFKTLDSVATVGTRLVAYCTLRDTETEMPLSHQTPYTIHPAVIDALVQVPLSGLGVEHEDEKKTAHLPSSIGHIAVSTEWPHEPGNRAIIGASVDRETSTSTAEMFRIKECAQLVINVADLKFKPVKTAPQAAATPRELCFRMSWKLLEEERKKIDYSALKKPARILVLTRNEESSRDLLAVAVCQHLWKRTAVMPNLRSMDGIIDCDLSRDLVVLLDLWQPLLRYLGETELEVAKKLLTQASAVMWVTWGATRSPVMAPVNLALGLVRTARSERNANSSTFDLDPRSEFSDCTRAGLIADAIAMSLLQESGDTEKEFAEDNGELCVPRIVPDEKLNLEVHRELGKSAPYRQNFLQPGRRLRLAPQTTIDPSAEDDLYFEDAPDMTVPDDGVEIAVASSAVSQADVVRDTLDNTSATIPRSCSGRVTRVGRDVRALKRGDLVCALAEGPFGTHALAKTAAVAPKPRHLTFEAAASIAGPLLAAYYTLSRPATVRRGEKVLVQLTGPAGLAAVEVARHLGAVVYVMIQSDNQRAIARKMGLPARRIFDARSIRLRQEVEKATHGQGMPVVLALSGCETLRMWEHLATSGRFFEIRTPGDHDKTRPELGLNASFASVDMVRLAAELPEEVKMAFGELVEKVDACVIRPPAVVKEIPVLQLSRGIQMVRDGAVESVVTTTNIEEQVSATHRISRFIFRGAPGVHLIAGGTGGLGLSMTKYLVDHGARDIVLLSRSGGDRAVFNQLREELQAIRVRLRVARCDIGDFGQVKAAVDVLCSGGKRICGVIHAAMVLRDGLLENLSYDDYQEVTRPKVHGAWNLHKATREKGVPLDYFVVLSSAAGILGSRGQSAYAAANTFLDSLIQYRVYHGLPGTSLDLTAVTGAGYLAENAERQDEVLRNFGNEAISEDEMLALLSAAVRGLCPAQCLTGMKLHLGRDGQWPYYASDARFAELKAECLAAAERAGFVPKPAVSPGNAFRAAKTNEEAMTIAAQGIVDKLSEVLTIAPDDVDVARNITAFGLDSLTAIELRNWIAKEFRANLQILELLSSGTIKDLAVLTVQKTRAS